MRHTFFFLPILAVMLTGCGSSKKVTDESLPTQSQTDTGIMERRIGSQTQLPKASVFRMADDYSNNVAVTLASNGTLAYYPAPSDITPQSAPIDLGNGWWLNRQGLGPSSVFTKWTFEEYAALKSTPSPREIIGSIIPGSAITDFRFLPINASEAFADPSVCRAYL